MEWAALLVLLFCSDVVEVVPAAERPSKHLLFLVDTSGSMEGDKFASACQAVVDIAAQPVDAMEIAILAFDDEVARWPGLPASGGPPPRFQATVPPRALPRAPARRVPPGWAALPSREAVRHASAWLARRPPEGGTRIIPALRAALAEPRKELTVVLVSDGQFYQERGEAILAALEEAQRAREAKGLGRALLLVFAVGEPAALLEDLGRLGRGGTYRRARAEDAADEGAPPQTAPSKPKRRSSSRPGTPGGAPPPAGPFRSAPPAPAPR
ncbi:MAG: VWA domain-containing protein [Planctomycetota bacterium]|nr:MAG: VWA domain-containing protein [Planctomycetota bacterium]